MWPWSSTNSNNCGSIDSQISHRVADYAPSGGDTYVDRVGFHKRVQLVVNDVSSFGRASVVEKQVLEYIDDMLSLDGLVVTVNV